MPCNKRDQRKSFKNATSASSRPVQVYFPCAGLVKHLKLGSKGCNKKILPQLEGSIKNIFIFLFRPFWSSSWIAAANTYGFIEFNYNTCLAHFNHFFCNPQCIQFWTKHLTFPFLSVMFCFLSGALCISQVLSIRLLTFFEPFLDKILNKYFSPSFLHLIAIDCNSFRVLILLSNTYSVTSVNLTFLLYLHFEFLQR